MNDNAIWSPSVGPAAARDLCTDCGVSRSGNPKDCGAACQFIKPDYPRMEARVHGRARDPGRPDEEFFGPFRRMLRASLKPARAGAQWTGIATRMAERLLATQAVDAVLTMAPDPKDRWRPMPVLVTQAEAMSEVRGMRMGYAPLLALLEPARARGYRRLAMIGIPCQVYPLRALERELGLERLYVIGTPCSDNTTTERFHEFLGLLSDAPETINYLEFRADYHVEIRFTDGRAKKIPFLQLPLAKLPPDFFPLTCRTCVDYTNVLADVTVGYMAGEGDQWLVVRNARGEELIELLGSELCSVAPGSAGKRAGPVKGFLANTLRAAGGLPLRRMPGWARRVVGWLMPRVGPRGLEFARARVEMKAIETIVHLRREAPQRLKSMVPDHVWSLVARYGLTPAEGERRTGTRVRYTGAPFTPAHQELTMKPPVKIGAIEIDADLYDFVNREAIPGTGVDAGGFWRGFAALVERLAPRNADLLDTRDRFQSAIDGWHQEHPGAQFDAHAYRAFLTNLGYLVAEPKAFTVTTARVDREIAEVAGPQLVVPVSNARYALNAANARWGSLYDALYGTDVIPDDGGAKRGTGYNRLRGARVIEFARNFLDANFPLTEGAHRDAAGYQVAEQGLKVLLRSGASAALAAPLAFKGFQGEGPAPAVILLEHHGLHVELHIDRDHFIGRDDAAGISDVVLESAVTTIQDCEDSVAAVSTADKITVYRNWLGLMTRSLEASLEKANQALVRRLNTDRRYRTPGGAEYVLPGRSLMLVRHVGHHMMTDAVTLNGSATPETFIDAAITSLAALHDLGPTGGGNSRAGSVYIVKPKMHGPEEVAFAAELFAGVEDLLGLPRDTLKMGIMDEERRTTVNLAACIRAVHSRVVFINTGFLDRTGDEIHTSMEAAAIPRKGDLKKARWLDAYERQNVDIGLACGLRGHAQIGKGMWAMPDLMADMLKAKIAHPRAGANTAWVPSPTAATLHALHYHQVDVAAVQQELTKRQRASLEDILTPALAGTPSWSAAEIEEELNNNAQSILGYVVRWIDFGVGCSKVPDYYNVALMEDRATLRISSQHVANWLRHGVCSERDVMAALERMARVVDQQNSGDPAYRPMSEDPGGSVAFQAASDLIFKGRAQPNGYTEAILTARRKERTRQPAPSVELS